VVELSSQLTRPSALTDWVYAAIKDAILSLAFPMAAQLHIEDLAVKFGLSRTPVREALLRLEKDGLVRAVPRVGFFVTQITRTDLKELFEIRQLLESHAVRTAAPTLTKADLEHLERLLMESESSVASKDLSRFLQAETDFHNYLIHHAPNRRLIDVMESLRDLTYRERVLSTRSEENLRLTVVEHRRILDALLQGNAQAAGDLMSRHIGDARDRMLQFLDLPEDNPSSVLNSKEG
jgi:DNA-binding GntR family transcriptional regulator